MDRRNPHTARAVRSKKRRRSVPSEVLEVPAHEFLLQVDGQCV